MPRDSAGNYLLAAGNPVISGTIIQATWANATMDDIADALTDSLSRTGQGGMISAFQFANGTQAQPSITWTAENGTGFYRDGPQDMRAVVSGINAMRWIDDGGTGAVVQIFDDSDSLWKDVAHENSEIRFGDGDIDNPTVTWFGTDGIDGVVDGWYRVALGDQRYVQDVAAVQTDVFRFFEGVAEINIDPAESALGFYPVVGTRLTQAQRPDREANDDEIVDAEFVRRWATTIAQGVGNGNGSGFVGNPFGAAAWNQTGTGDFTLTLSTPLSNVNNCVCHVTCVDNAEDDGFYAKVRLVTDTTHIDIRVFDEGGVPSNADTVMFTVADTALN